MVSTTTTTFILFNHIGLESKRSVTVRSITAMVLSGVYVSILLLFSIMAVVYVTHNHLQKPQSTTSAFPHIEVKHVSRMAGWSEKIVVADRSTEWQRPSYHFRPYKNFISDPDGPLYHMGWYHLFYQYNRDSVLWGNVTWGHAVSKDLINWFELPLAMVPDQWYDFHGVMTGSATILPDGRIIMLYSGAAYDLTQYQCLVVPANSSDPLLLKWNKYEGNPLLFPPPGIGLQEFRDPSTTWIGPDGKYRILIASKLNNTIGCALVYHTTDFIHFELLDEVLHSVPGTGMWECVDIYPVSTTDMYGLDMSDHAPGNKYVLKQSGDEDRHDWYAIGSYDPVKDKWYPDDPEMDLLGFLCI